MKLEVDKFCLTVQKIAKPGDVVFLKSDTPITDEEIYMLVKRLQHVKDEFGINLVLFDNHLNVVAITETKAATYDGPVLPVDETKATSEDGS